MTDKKIVCTLCGAELEQISTGEWVDVVSGDDGGTYDYCPDSPYEDTEDKIHKPKAVTR